MPVLRSVSRREEATKEVESSSSEDDEENEGEEEETEEDSEEMEKEANLEEEEEEDEKDEEEDEEEEEEEEEELPPEGEMEEMEETTTNQRVKTRGGRKAEAEADESSAATNDAVVESVAPSRARGKQVTREAMKDAEDVPLKAQKQNRRRDAKRDQAGSVDDPPISRMTLKEGLAAATGAGPPRKTAEPTAPKAAPAGSLTKIAYKGPRIDLKTLPNLNTTKEDADEPAKAFRVFQRRVQEGMANMRDNIASMQKELDLLKKKKRHRAEEPDSTAIAFGGRVRSWQFKYLTLVGCEFYAMVERPWDFHPLMAFLADPMPRLEFAPPLLARYRAMRGMALLTEGLSQLAKLSASNPPRTNQTLIALRECVALYLVTRSECSNQSLGTFLRLGQLEMNEAMGYPEQDFRSIKVKSVVSSETLRVYSGAEWACNLSNPELVTGEAYRNPEQYREDCDADRKRGVRRDIGDGGWTHVGTHAGGLAATELPHRSITEVGQMASNANRPTRTLLEARGRGDGRCKKCARPGHLGRSCPRPDPRYRPENEWWFLKQVLAGNEKVV